MQNYIVMSYQVIARKFRPQSFAEVSGQEHVTRTLGNSIKRNKIAHAYVFTGLRGVGKTSIARIFAKSLNCVEGPTATPCQKCEQCLGITKGSSLAVREIDGASNNSVENVRDLIDSFMTMPPPGSRYKIYIIDEVHMLSMSAFNALLKTLEEPPSYAIFMLATTEVHKIPETIMSRCQRHDLRALTQAEVIARLKEIAAAENFSSDEASLKLIARLSEGSMRDAQTMLERVQSFTEGKITIAETSSVLGVVERSALYRMSAAVFSQNAEGALQELAQVFSRGVDPSILLREFVSHWRELLLAKVSSPETLQSIGISQEDITELRQQVQPISTIDIQELSRIARDDADKALRSSEPRFALEALLTRMALRQPTKDLLALINEIKKTGVSTTANSGGGSGGGNQTPKAAAPITTPPVKPISPASIKAVEPQRAPTTTTPQQNAQLTAPQPSQKEAFRWENFVEYVGKQSGAKILAEQLKRVGALANEGAQNTLDIRGPSFQIDSLSKLEVKQKLYTLLEQFSGAAWEIRFTALTEAKGAEATSIAAKESAHKELHKKQRNEDIINHPSIKSLQKIFPGTTIEDIQFKNEDN